jgi:hypothetical protein
MIPLRVKVVVALEEEEEDALLFVDGVVDFEGCPVDSSV